MILKNILCHIIQKLIRTKEDEVMGTDGKC